LKKKIWSATFIIILISVYSTAYSAEKLRVLNPTPPNRMVDRVPLTPRLDTLEGKTIFLVPSVKVEVRGIKGSYMQDQPELWKEISENGDAAMIGISG
jgi:hypothetical protein